MIEEIVKMVMATLKKAIERNATEKGVAEHNVQIRINTKDAEEASPLYRFLLNFKVEPDSTPITFNQMIGVKLFDIKGREAFVKPFLQKSFRYISIKENIPLFSINLMAIMSESKTIKLYLYNGGTFVKEINVDYVVTGMDEYDTLIKDKE